MESTGFVFGLMGFIFGLNAMSSITAVSKRVKALEQQLAEERLPEADQGDS